MVQYQLDVMLRKLSADVVRAHIYVWLFFRAHELFAYCILLPHFPNMLKTSSRLSRLTCHATPSRSNIDRHVGAIRLTDLASCACTASAGYRVPQPPAKLFVPLSCVHLRYSCLHRLRCGRHGCCCERFAESTGHSTFANGAANGGCATVRCAVACLSR